MISKVEIGTCVSFFNSGGYVLDFSTNDFDAFTLSTVGVALCAEYQMSKGRSLMAYVEKASTSDTIILLKALLEHYELSVMFEQDKMSNPLRIKQYEKCKAILAKASSVNLYAVQAAQMKQDFNSDYIAGQIDLMLRMQAENPTEAIGKAKELIESCCKTVLKNLGVEVNPKWDVMNLVDEVFKSFKIMPKDIDDNVKGAKSIKQILGSLKAIAQGVVELRNLYGSGHGKDGSFIGLEPRHAQLAVGSSITLVNFIWDSYERNHVTRHD